MGPGVGWGSLRRARAPLPGAGADPFPAPGPARLPRRMGEKPPEEAPGTLKGVFPAQRPFSEAHEGRAQEGRGGAKRGAERDPEAVLKSFDLDSRFGPCSGMSRLERWERASRLGLDPPKDVEALLRGPGGQDSQSVWDQMGASGVSGKVEEGA